MSLFEFTFALSAVVLGMALAHVAATIHRLLLAGRRVKWAPEPVLLTIIVLLVIVSVWLFPWFDRELASVTIGEMLLRVTQLLGLYIGAASCLPEPPVAESSDPEPIDLYDFYDRTRALSFGALIVSMTLVQILGLVTYGWPTQFSFGLLTNWLAGPVLYGSLIFVRKRWFNILVLGFVVIFYGGEIIGIRLNA